MFWATSLAKGGMTNGQLPSRQKTATARLHVYFPARRHLPVELDPPPPLLLQPPPPFAATTSLVLLSSWLSCQFSLCCCVLAASTSCHAIASHSVALVPFVPVSCPAGCCINSPHAATSNLAVDHLGSQLSPLAVSLSLVPPLSRLLSDWLLHCLSLCCCLPCQRLRLLPRRRLLFCRSRASCLAGCCVASPQLSRLLSGWLLRRLSSRHHDPYGGRSLGATAFPSCRTVASLSYVLVPLVWMVVELHLLTLLHPLPAPLPLATPLPLVLPLLRLLSGWLLCRLSSRLHIPCQRLHLSLRRRLLFLRSHTSFLAGCCVASPHAAASP